MQVDGENSSCRVGAERKSAGLIEATRWRGATVTQGCRLTSTASDYSEDIVRQKTCNQSHAGRLVGGAADLVASLPDYALIGAATMLQLYGVKGNATLYRWERAGFIPPSRKIRGSSQRRWVVGEVRAALWAVARGNPKEADHAAA